MTKNRAYSGTQVTVTRSKREMESILKRYGAIEPYANSENPDTWRDPEDAKYPYRSTGGLVYVEFGWEGLAHSCRMQSKLSDWQFAGGGFREHLNREMRIAARSLYYRVKITMESISSGDMTPVAALFPYLIIPRQGITVSEKPDSELIYLIGSGRLQLPAKASEGGDGSDIYRRELPSAARD